MYRAAFFLEPPADVLRGRRQAQRNGPLGRAGLHRQHGRQRFGPVGTPCCIERRGGIERLVEHYIELGQQAHEMLARNAVMVAPDIVIVGRNTKVRAEALHGVDVAVRAEIRHSKTPEK